ncbi:ABC-type nitrate/sulfonate/bicarbonate transport system permease component [Clostridium acetobutylicum]|uniref:ABC transporter, permease component n=1 Tax=Clostridium acetobutylicum (strain ATCC 824 / DSM 792 / JCM 1419 / IAM 19013 / LMG 5710 / NBRC 13948 / NRRL B-527 / VKM B-1787 / 2291 / W) TaxID=272562 RepID=Q97J87_CLOAB|nr:MULTISPECIES: ABC transporter permease [Clostridium]AAK79367.1 ABC transporter, permease component [Clostridium acetobutylicum ATCC 824]ADZ20452.1 ABC transporter, permease component [Clostridium acetobutylicum EA 2018]AEI33483.1 ABC transporter, permease component [Clostridium acetobutylicum DSM 1731]AWV81384.1 ABC transporter permease [Clostridium acetobutylicum]MBC2393018.1 ABC transporter permease [Clostridium acetobutylicum]
MKKWENIKNKVYPVAALIAVIILWQLIVDFRKIPEYVIPSPKDICLTLISEFGTIMQNTKVTIYESLVGFFIAIIFAFILAIIMDSFQIVRKALYPIIVISQTIPTIAIAPLFIIWFGFGPLPKIIVVVITCFFPIVISLIDGFEKIDKDYINLFRSMKASRIQIFYHLKLPSAMVNLFSGIKIACTYMIMAAVIGEWLGGDGGIGVYMVRAKNAYALDKVFASIVVIVIISIVLIYIVDFIGKRIIHWK